MRSQAQLVRDHTNLTDAQAAVLQGLIEEWHVLADLSFSDLVLWVPGQDEFEFWAVAQIRPDTGPTALVDDVVGECIRYDDEHLVTEAFMSEVICETSSNKLHAGIPVDVWAIPVLRAGVCIGVVERHTNQMGVRAPGELEDNYLEVAHILSDMVWRGAFPGPGMASSTASPRVGEGIVRLDADGVVVYASPNAVTAWRRLGFAGELRGERLTDVARDVLGDGEPVDPTEGRWLRSDITTEVDWESSDAVVRARVIPLTGSDGRVGTLLVLRDNTEVRHRDRQLVTKDATIREIHHRVKNNLQTVAALLRLQARRITSPEGSAALHDAMNRVQAIAVVHETLSQSYSGAVEFDEIADRLMRTMGDVAAAQGKVHASREGSFGLVPAAAATSLSLVLTELVQNAIEHGLSSASGRVVVHPYRDGQTLVVEVSDDGVGLPDGFELVDAGRSSLGLSIVSTLVQDLHGTFDLGANDGGRGSKATVRMPLPENWR